MEILDRTFKGSNEYGEIETAEEFYKFTLGKEPSEVDLSCFTFTQVDLSNETKIPKDHWDAFNIKGASFFGCKFPSYTTVEEVRKRGGNVHLEPEGLPFKAFRAFLYSQDELLEKDAEIYKFYKQRNDLKSVLSESVHDYFIQDALFDYLEGKTIVVVMGGHQMKRSTKAYRDVVLLGYKLAKKGIVVATGGGPGAMEAANLGAYLFERTEKEVDEALEILNSKKCTKEHEYLDFDSPNAVIKRFGKPTYAPSLGVPTYRYGHEPSNLFATNIAKMFSNAVREAGLINIGNGGIIYTPGSAGTRQEIFQAACLNHYSEKGREVPMVFYDTKFWSESGVVDVLRKSSKDRPFGKLILESDSVDDIVAFHTDYCKTHNLPMVTLKELQAGNHWETDHVNGSCPIKAQQPPTKKQKRSGPAKLARRESMMTLMDRYASKNT